MPMPPYSVRCTSCAALAVVKIAARWSDGTTHELKTYALACAGCAANALAAAERKREACPLAPGETLEVPFAFPLQASATGSGAGG